MQGRWGPAGDLCFVDQAHFSGFRGNAAQMGRGRADVALIIVDDLRPDLGAYGRSWAATPFMDRLAASSVVFTQAHASMANCAPSRASLLTGLRPNVHGVLDLNTHHRDRHPDLVTLPQRFRQAGYLAVSIGKVFHQKLDDARSWSGQAEWRDNHTYRGLRGDAWAKAGGWTRGWRYNQYHMPDNLRLQHVMRTSRAAGNWSVGINSLLPPFERGEPAHAPEASYTDARLGSFAIATLRRLRAQSRRWLLAVGFVRPHLPFNAPSRHWKTAEAAHAPPPEASIDAAASSRALRLLSPLTAAHLVGGNGEVLDFAGPRQLGPPAASDAAARSRVHGLVRGYAASVAFVDGQVGRLVSALGDADGGNASSTVVALLGDHGIKLGEWGGWGKHTLMATDTHVPLLISAPGIAPRRVHEPVELVDVYPTICHLAGVRTPARQRPPLAGRSLLPLMRGRPPARRVASAVAFSQYPLRRPRRCMGYAVRIRGWTLLQWAADPRRVRAQSAADGRECASHYDLLRVGQIESHKGVLIETPVAANDHPGVVRKLRRRLARVLGLDGLELPTVVIASGSAGGRSGRRRRATHSAAQPAVAGL